MGGPSSRNAQSPGLVSADPEGVAPDAEPGRRLQVRPLGTALSVEPASLVDGALEIPLFADVHGNLGGLLRALQALSSLRQRRFPLVVVAGDLGFFPFPEAMTDEHRRREFRDGTGLDLPNFFDRGEDAIPALRDPDLHGTRILFVRGNHESHGLLRGLNAAFPGQAVEVHPSGLLNYLTDGAAVDVLCGDERLLRMGAIGGIARGDRPKSLARDPGLDFDPASFDLLLGAVSQGRDIDLLVTHQGPSPLPGGHEDIDALVELAMPRLLVCGHGHSPVGPVDFAGTACIEVAALGHAKRPDIGSGSVALLHVPLEGPSSFVAVEPARSPSTPAFPC